MIQNFMFGDEKQQLEVIKYFRQLLFKEPDLFVDILGGIAPKFVEFLKDGSINHQFEAAWALSNIAVGNSFQTSCVVDAGALPVLIHLLSSPSENVQKEAFWCLGNIAADCPECRDLVLDHDILSSLSQYVFNKMERSNKYCNSYMFRFISLLFFSLLNKPIKIFFIIKDFIQTNEFKIEKKSCVVFVQFMPW